MHRIINRVKWLEEYINIQSEAIWLQINILAVTTMICWTVRQSYWKMMKCRHQAAVLLSMTNVSHCKMTVKLTVSLAVLCYWSVSDHSRPPRHCHDECETDGESSSAVLLVCVCPQSSVMALSLCWWQSSPSVSGWSLNVDTSATISLDSSAPLQPVTCTRNRTRHTRWTHSVELSRVSCPARHITGHFRDDLPSKLLDWCKILTRKLCYRKNDRAMRAI